MAWEAPPRTVLNSFEFFCDALVLERKEADKKRRCKIISGVIGASQYNQGGGLPSFWEAAALHIALEVETVPTGTCPNAMRVHVD